MFNASLQPEPIFTFDTYDSLLAIGNRTLEAEKPSTAALCSAYCDVIERLPTDNLHVLRVLLWLCHDIIQHEDKTRMTPRSLGKKKADIFRALNLICFVRCRHCNWTEYDSFG